MAKNYFDVFGCSLCEREVVTESGTKKEYVCCDLPMRMVKENTDFEKIDSTEWPAEKLVATLKDEVRFTETDYIGKVLVATPAIQVKVLSFKAGQETIYEKAGNDMSLFVIEGDGVLALGYEDVPLTESTVVVVPKGMLWGVKNTGGSAMVILQTANRNKVS